MRRLDIDRLLPLTLVLAATVATPAFAQDKPTTPQAAAAQAEAKKLSDGFVAVAEKTSPSVVQIDVTARDENADQIARFFGKNQDSPIARGTGSGVIGGACVCICRTSGVVANAVPPPTRCDLAGGGRKGAERRLAGKRARDEGGLANRLRVRGRAQHRRFRE